MTKAMNSRLDVVEQSPTSLGLTKMSVGFTEGSPQLFF